MTEAGAKRAGFFLNVAPALLYVFAIFYVGLAHIPQGGAKLPHLDKLVHALSFGFMQLVVLRAVRFEVARVPPRRQNLVAFLLVVGAGGLLELVQSFTSYRSAELLDWLADAVGAGAVALVVERLRAR